jgi:hypothetical protein
MKFVKNLMDMEELPLAALRREAQSLANARSLNQFMSRLEIESISHACLVDYLYRILIFLSVAKMSQRSWCDAPSLDLTLVLTFDDMRAMLFSASDASKMLAAIKLVFPEVSLEQRQTGSVTNGGFGRLSSYLYPVVSNCVLFSLFCLSA